MAKKGSTKSKGKVPPKKSKPKPKPKTTPVKKTSRTSRSVPRIQRPLKESRQPKHTNVLRPATPHPKSSRDFTRTKTFKSFEKKFLQPKRLRNRSGKFTKYKSGKYRKTKSDSSYANKIKSFWKQQYNIKGQSAKDVLKQVQKTFQQNTRNRFVKTKIMYWGKTAPQKKDGKWIKGKPKKRYLWRDKLTGKYLKGKAVGIRMLKAMEPVLIKNFMQKKGLKNYQKARKRFLKEIKNESLRNIIQLYGPY